MSAIPRLEWPSPLVSFDDLTAVAGRVEYELNAAGDPKFIGYAFKADARTDAEGWIIEYRTYDGSDNLIGTYRRAGLTWNQREAIIDLVLLKNFSPAVGSISIGAVGSAVQHKRGVATGAIYLNEVSRIAVAKYKAATAVGTVVVSAKAPAIQIGIAKAFAQLVISSVNTQFHVDSPLGDFVIGTLDFTATVVTNSVRGQPAVGDVVLSSTVTAEAITP